MKLPRNLSAPAVFFVLSIPFLLSCSGDSGLHAPTGPVEKTTSDPAAPAAADNTAAVPQDTQTTENADAQSQAREIVMTSSVRVTNTSGGRVIVLGELGRPKPVIVHFAVDTERSDLFDMGKEERWLSWYLDFFPDGSPSHDRHGMQYTTSTNGYVITERDLRAGHKVVWVDNRHIKTGRWRETRMTVRFAWYGEKSHADNDSLYNAPDLLSEDGKWKLKNRVHENIPVDVVVPHSADVVFHPVVTDSAQIMSGTWWLRGAVEELGDPHELFLYTPLMIQEHRIGFPVVVDPDGGDFLKQALVALRGHDEIGRGYIRDFHVAVVPPDLSEGTDYGGKAYLGINVSSVVWQDDLEDTKEILLHEIGHNLSMGHVHCGSSPGCFPGESDYPGLTSKINADGYRLVGYSYASNFPPWNDIEVVPASEYDDIMSYGDPRWLSAYTYRKTAEFGFGMEPTLLPMRRTVSEPVISTCYPRHE